MRVSKKNTMLLLTKVDNVTGKGFSVTLKDGMQSFQLSLGFLDALEKLANMSREFFKIGLSIME